ncbi:permease [Bifidobacterium margollesii]|uniref:Permease n=1 Tax=Bifidobacterium margollesii TaxID=2020964 RepID=A0A2N5J7E0_9BIFI|nr:hypothetical protein [Bifidobacterium margollesii]PLS30107.1 permease [Bifidobacterium margollesii]
MNNATLTSVLNLVSQALVLGGGALIVFGGVSIGTNLKDHNSPAITGGILQIGGGALIIACAAIFRSLRG